MRPRNSITARLGQPNNHLKKQSPKEVVSRGKRDQSARQHTSSQHVKSNPLNLTETRDIIKPSLGAKKSLSKKIVLKEVQ